MELWVIGVDRSGPRLTGRRGGLLPSFPGVAQGTLVVLRFLRPSLALLGWYLAWQAQGLMEACLYQSSESKLVLLV
jgi:hypothetical protein